MRTFVKKTRTYYKYIYDTFTQPALSSNTSDPDFVVSSPTWGTGYLLFDNNYWTGYDVYIAHGRPNVTVVVALGNPCAFTGFRARQQRNGDNTQSGLNYALSASNDNINWTTIYTANYVMSDDVTYNFENKTYYKYYRFYVTCQGGYDQDQVNFRELTFYGTKRHTVESSVSDYDFYTETAQAKVKGVSDERTPVWVSWNSPTNMTSNTSYGVISGNMNYTWFKGNNGAGVQHSNGATYTAYWEFPEVIRLNTVYWYIKPNPDRWGTTGTMRFYSVSKSGTETQIGTASYTGSGGSASLDSSVDVSKLKVTVTGSWSGANGVWHLPIAFAGERQTTLHVVSVQAYKV